jgi:tRNA(fMet)-specific endonuclease VapC
MESLTFDTSFLIDFQRERKNRRRGRAHEFLQIHAAKGAYLSLTAYGEYAEGFEKLSDAAFVSVVDSFELLPSTRKTAEVYGRIARALRTMGLLIGANDLWIAATAIENDFPLVTSNTRHFARVPDLLLMSY